MGQGVDRLDEQRGRAKLGKGQCVEATGVDQGAEPGGDLGRGARGSEEAVEVISGADPEKQQMSLRGCRIGVKVEGKQGEQRGLRSGTGVRGEDDSA